MRVSGITAVKSRCGWITAPFIARLCVPHRVSSRRPKGILRTQDTSAHARCCLAGNQGWNERGRAPCRSGSAGADCLLLFQSAARRGTPRLTANAPPAALPYAEINDGDAGQIASFSGGLLTSSSEVVNATTPDATADKKIASAGIASRIDFTRRAAATYRLDDKPRRQSRCGSGVDFCQPDKGSSENRPDAATALVSRCPPHPSAAPHPLLGSAR
jgi:hypothetical protein